MFVARIDRGFGAAAATIVERVPVGRGIPEFTEHGLLPVGTHHASIGEFVARFGRGEGRERFALEEVLNDLSHGIDRVRVGGSGVTSKPRPGDLDLLYHPNDIVDADAFNAAGSRAMEKGVELHPAHVRTGPRPDDLTQEELFRMSRSGHPVGLVEIDLRSGWSPAR